MRNVRFLGTFGAGLLAACVASLSPASANLLLNGSFESPIVPGSSPSCGPGYGSAFNADCQGYYSPDQPGYPGGPNDIDGWTVIGKGGAYGDAVVLQLGTNYSEPDGANGETLHFHAQDGGQSLDLTGEGNQGLTNGVKQSVTTDVGDLYRLSFFVGNQYNPAPGYPSQSSITLWIDGIEKLTFSNAKNRPEDVSWLKFTYSFIAPADFTTIAFLNSTDVGDNYAGLDNVVLRAVPEPGTLALLLGGLTAFLALRRRKPA